MTKVDSRFWYKGCHNNMDNNSKVTTPTPDPATTARVAEMRKRLADRGIPFTFEYVKHDKDGNRIVY